MDEENGDRTFAIWLAERSTKENELEDYRDAEQRDRAVRWAKSIRVKENLIRWPFTHDIVRGAVRHFGVHHRPLLPYVLDDDEYDELLIAIDNGHGYQFYGANDSYDIPEINTWRDFAEWRGEKIEDFAAEWDLDEKELDETLGDGILEEHLPYSATPEGRAYDTLHAVFHPPAKVELPIGELGLHCGNVTYAWIQPKVALTFAQILLDYEETGIKIVLEEDWSKHQSNPERGA